MRFHNLRTNLHINISSIIDEVLDWRNEKLLDLWSNYIVFVDNIFDDRLKEKFVVYNRDIILNMFMSQYFKRELTKDDVEVENNIYLVIDSELIREKRMYDFTRTFTNL